MELKQIIPYLIPLVLLQLVLQVWCTLILVKEETKVKFDKKWIWAIIIWLFQIPGAIVFLLLGRDEG